MDVGDVSAQAAGVEECPILRALGAFDRPLLSQGAEGVRCHLSVPRCWLTVVLTRVGTAASVCSGSHFCSATRWRNSVSARSTGTRTLTSDSRGNDCKGCVAHACTAAGAA